MNRHQKEQTGMNKGKTILPLSEEAVRSLPFDLLARQVVEGFITGLHKSPYHGFSVEFAEHRLYNHGESIRAVDWKLFGRTEKLFVKRYEEETNLRCQLVVDSSNSMRYEGPFGTKLYHAAVSAASLMHILQRQRDAFGLTIFSDRLVANFACKATASHLHLLMAALDSAIRIPDQSGKTAIATTLHTLADQFHKRSLVIVFSDLLENLSEPEHLIAALLHLRHNKHEVLVVQVVDVEKELNLRLDNIPYQFMDMESGKVLKVNPVQVRKHYQQKMAEFQERLERSCAASGIEWVRADAGLHYEEVLTAYLAKRQMMRI